MFVNNPERYIEETKDLIVCPTCLAEKPKKNATLLNIDGQDVYFCHCPHCMDLYKKDTEFYINRLEGSIPKGVLGHDGCCIAPSSWISKYFPMFNLSEMKNKVIPDLYTKQLQ